MRIRKVTIDPITQKRTLSNRDTIIRTEFGLWMNQRMMRNGMRHIDVANKLHVSRQAVSGHSSGLAKPTFQNVVSYCWVFGCNDDPEEIWKLVDEDIED